MTRLTPAPEAERLAALHRYAVLDTAPEVAFERITSLAAHLFGMPIARISFVDEDRVWFKSSHGAPAVAVPREHSACARVIESEEVFIVSDAAADPQFCRDPLVRGEPHARFYVGTPLRTADGFNLGALCLVGLEAREFGPGQQESLKQLAAVVMDALETRLANRRLAAEVEARQQVEAALADAQAGREVMLAAAFDAIIGLDHAGRILELNPAAERLFGHPLADAAGREMADLFIAPARQADYRRDTAPLHATGYGPVLGERRTLAARRADGTEFPIELVLTRVAEDGPWAFTGHVRDLTAQRAGENRLRMLESSIENANDAILVTEAEPLAEPGPRIIFANRAFTRTTGYTLEEVLGKTPRLLQGPKTSEEAKRQIHDALTLWQEVRVELINYRKDGTEFWVELNIVPVGDGRGNYTHWVSVQRVITERKEAQSALEQARDEAQSANRAKSEFLSRMSHELRTPLNAILGFGQLIEMDAVSTDRQRDRVGHILKGGRHLLGLINEVLDISRIESGQMEMTLEPLDACEVCNGAAALLQPLADQRNVRLGRCATPADGAAMLADRQRLSQVLLNLLSNAIKYNREGGTVSLSCGAAATAGWRLAVRDTGFGLAPADQAKLFMPFERLGAAHGVEEGTGIGLALSKRLAEAMGGRLGVESVPGLGSTFYLELPAAAAPAPSAAVPELPAPPAPASGKRTLLCIEDNLSNYSLVEQVVEYCRPDIRLFGALRGQLGLELARKHLPDLILLDMQLPDASGDELLRCLQADARTRHIPVVMVSADATEGQSRRLLGLGAKAYLTKPLNIPAFLKTLEEALAAPAVSSEP